MKNNKRPSFDEVYIKLAEIISKRSTCGRLQVGTVITTTDYRKVLSIGYLKLQASKYKDYNFVALIK